MKKISGFRYNRTTLQSRTVTLIIAFFLFSQGSDTFPGAGFGRRSTVGRNGKIINSYLRRS